MKKTKSAPILAIAALMLTVTACTDDTFKGKPDEVNGEISYKTAIWNNAAVSRNPDGTRHFVSMNTDKINGTDYWMITTVENGIDNKTTADADVTATPASRGVQRTIANFYDAFKVFAYAYAPSENSTSYADNYTNSWRFINGETATKSDNDTYWNTQNKHYWTTSNFKLAFFGLAPAANDNYVITNEEHARASLAYTVCDAVADQPDVMIAEETCPGSGNLGSDVVSLNFKHLLTAVKVKVNTQKDPDGTFAKSIKSVKFKNVKYKGTYLFGSTGFAAATDVKDAFALAINTEPIADGGEYALADGENTFMMMPQTFGDDSGAVLEVTTSDGRTLTVNLAGTTAWTAGTTVTYYISDEDSLVEYVIDVPEDGIKFSWMAETRKCPVRSYKITYKKDGETKVQDSEVPVKWKTSIKITSKSPEEMPSYDNSARWITNEPTGNGATSTAAAADTTSFSSIQSEPFETKTPDDDLIKAHPKLEYTLNEGYYDLATPTGGGVDGSEKSYITTANCYVIDAPGEYKIPLVFGNARVNGADNSSAYAAWQSESSNRLNTFVTATAANISSGNYTYLWYNYSTIYKSYQKPVSAKVVWQDHQNLLRNANLGLSDSDRYLRFSINKDDMAAGNIVIGVYSDNGNCVWSWHIWVTPYKPGYSNTEEGVNGDITLTNNAGGTSVMTEKPLGYVAGTWQHWAERSAVCTFYQVDDNGNKIGKEAKINLTQEEHWFRPETATYYQWGRKDPLPGIMCSEAGGLDDYNCYQYTYTFKKIYDGDGNEISVKYQDGTEYHAINGGSGYCSIPMGIREPLTFYTGKYWYVNASEYGSGSRAVYWNLWGAYGSGNLTSSKKTVYDPCPKGYKVPPLSALPRLTCTGGSLSAGEDDFDKSIRDEDYLFQNMWNTPYTEHTQYINNFGFQIYTGYMNAEGEKPTNSSTINLLALGHRQRQDGTPFNLGAYFYYWSASATVTGTADTSAQYYYINGGYLKGNCGLYPNAQTNWSSLGLPVWPVKED